MTAWGLLGWAKAFGLPLLAVAVSCASVLAVSVFSWWQVRIAREKLRHDLYDRRFGIYMAFHELFVAICEKDDVDPELRKANAARAHGPFLLDAKLATYLEGLHREAFRINATNKLIRDPTLVPLELIRQASQLGSDKLNFANRVAELVREFERFLKLRDFSKQHEHKASAT
jgi:hypothetical protein